MPVTAKQTRRTASAVTWLLNAFDQAFVRRSWHGTNLRGSLRNVTADEATWRPGPKRRCIAEHVLHTAYWKYAARRRILGEKRGSFPFKGHDWFPLPRPWNPATWKLCIKTLEDQHAALRSAIATLGDSDLFGPAGGTGGDSTGFLISGVTAHDLYHTGQIQLLKRLQR